MEDTTQPAAPTNEQGAATASQPTEREQQLDSQLTATTKERDKLKSQVGTVTADRDKLKSQVGTLTADRDSFKGKFETADAARIAAETERDELREQAAQPKDEQPEAAADERAETKKVLRRNGLTKAWVLPDGSICFQESHAKHVAGEEFESLTVISAE